MDLLHEYTKLVFLFIFHANNAKAQSTAIRFVELNCIRFTSGGSLT